jgi:hypothetical protein
MISINLMLVVQSAIQIVLILDIYLGFGPTKEKAINWFSVGTTLPVVIIMGIFLFFDVASLSLIGQLLIFHLKLQKKGISTYEFIVQDNQEKREKKKKLNELKLRRQTEITKAKEEGSTLLVLRLEKGGLLREKLGLTWCDPLSLEADQSNSNGPKISSNGHYSNGDV